MPSINKNELYTAIRLCTKDGLKPSKVGSRETLFLIIVGRIDLLTVAEFKVWRASLSKVAIGRNECTIKVSSMSRRNMIASAAMTTCTKTNQRDRSDTDARPCKAATLGLSPIALLGGGRR